jgi:MYXO-CTERM domain-containing protein
VALLAVSAPAGQARGNGALPASFGILLPADRPQEIVLATNFGMIISEDGGATWLWTCEQSQTALGYLYSVGPAPRNRFYGLTPEVGLAFSDDGSCSWRRSGGPLATLIASDFFVDRADPERLVAVASTFDPETLDVGPDSVFESTDAGSTFADTPLYQAPADANVVSLEIARSNPMVVYVALYRTPDKHPRLLRSSDGGRTWMERDVEPGIGAHEFRILAIDSDDADVLYLRVIVPGAEHVMVTRDAGLTFATPVTVTGPFGGRLSAFLRMESGTVLVGGFLDLMGGGMDGVAYRSTDGGRTFVPWTLTPQPHILGLAERDGVLYVAGKNYSDGWALATSRDEGLTITPLSEYDDVRGIKPCAMNICQDQCSLVASQAVWTNDVCSGALLPDGGLDAGLPPTPPGTGCHCAAAQAEARATVAVVALVGIVFAVWRRRRRRA